jgi:predicted ferric reductase
MKYVAYLLLAANAVVVLLIWWMGSAITLQSDPILAIGRLTGLFAIYFVLLQFSLIGRIRFAERAFGLDKLSKLHHTFGKYGIFLIILHPILIIISYAKAGKIDVVSQFIDLLLHYPDVWQAFVASLIFVFMVVCSLAIVRLKLRYEWWYWVHLMVYSAVILSWGHQLKNGGDFVTPWSRVYWYAIYSFVLGGFVLYRFMRPLWLFAVNQFRVSKVVKENDNVTSVYIEGKNMGSLPREGGNFIILRFLDKYRWWEAHPFSLSWGPRHDQLRVTIKNSGDFTSHIHQIKPGTRVLVDGLYGTFTKRKASLNKILFLAGGIGITPIRSLIEDFGEDGIDMMLLWSNTNKKDLIFQDEFRGLGKNLKLKIINFFSETEGHLDEQKLKRLVPDVSSREVYLCGPVPFMDAMIKVLHDLGVKKEYVHFEKFSMH